MKAKVALAYLRIVAGIILLGWVVYVIYRQFSGFGTYSHNIKFLLLCVACVPIYIVVDGVMKLFDLKLKQSPDYPAYLAFSTTSQLMRKLRKK